MSKIIKCFAGLVSMFIVGCAHTDLSVSTTDLPTPTEVPGIEFQGEFSSTWMEQIIFAYHDFSKTREDMSCYGVSIYKEDSLYVVQFVRPIVEEPAEGDMVVLLPYRAEECQNGASYEFDSMGKFIRRVNTRL